MSQSKTSGSRNFIQGNQLTTTTSTATTTTATTTTTTAAARTTNVLAVNEVKKL